jgi:hypothetical protein
MPIPADWTITKTLEEVPATNAGTAYSSAPFVRWTYICTDENDQFVCASGSEPDCEAQALSMFQSQTQVTAPP